VRRTQHRRPFDGRRRSDHRPLGDERGCGGP
jgi:hypothetical protein